jgi:hypothetical protein
MQHGCCNLSRVRYSVPHHFADAGLSRFLQVRLDSRVVAPAADGHHGSDVPALLDEVVSRPAPAEIVTRHVPPACIAQLVGEDILVEAP